MSFRQGTTPFFSFFSVIAFSTKSSGEQGMRLPDEMLMATLNTPTPCDRSVTMAGFLFNSAGFVPPSPPRDTRGEGGLPQISLKSVALKHKHSHSAHGNTHNLYKERQRGRERAEIYGGTTKGYRKGAPSSLQASSILWPLATLPLYQLSPQSNCIKTGSCAHDPRGDSDSA